MSFHFLSQAHWGVLALFLNNDVCNDFLKEEKRWSYPLCAKTSLLIFKVSWLVLGTFEKF